MAPIHAIRGDRRTRRRLQALIAYTYMVLGFPMAFHKAAQGVLVGLIGAQLEILKNAVRATMTQAKVDELKALTHDMLKSNVIPKAELRSFVGKWQSAASLLSALRPWISELSAALRDEMPSNAAASCVWKQQIQHTLLWLEAFLNSQYGPIIRIFKVSSYFNKGPIICIAMDASIYGMGAVLFIDRVAVEFFAIRNDKNDEKYLGDRHGDKDSQQVWESMVSLVVVKHWLPIWQ